MKNLGSELLEDRVNAVERNPRTLDPIPKGEAKRNTILRLLPDKRTYSKLVPQKVTGQNFETNQKQKNCREKNLVYSGLKIKNEDQAIGQKNGLEAKTFREET